VTEATPLLASPSGISPREWVLLLHTVYHSLVREGIYASFLSPLLVGYFTDHFGFDDGTENMTISWIIACYYLGAMIGALLGPLMIGDRNMIISDAAAIGCGFLQCITNFPDELGSSKLTLLLCFLRLVQGFCASVTFATLIYKAEQCFQGERRAVLETTFGTVGTVLPLGAGFGYLLGVLVLDLPMWLQVPMLTLVLVPALLATCLHPTTVPTSDSSEPSKSERKANDGHHDSSPMSSLRSLLVPAQSVPLAQYISLAAVLVTHFMFVGAIELLCFRFLQQSAGQSAVEAGLTALGWVGISCIVAGGIYVFTLRRSSYSVSPFALVVWGVLLSSLVGMAHFAVSADDATFGITLLMLSGATLGLANYGAVDAPFQIAECQGVKLDEDESKVVASAFPLLLNGGLFLGLIVSALLYDALDESQSYGCSLGLVGAIAFVAAIVAMSFGWKVPGWLACATLCDPV